MHFPGTLDVSWTCVRPKTETFQKTCHIRRVLCDLKCFRIQGFCETENALMTLRYFPIKIIDSYLIKKIERSKGKISKRIFSVLIFTSYNSKNLHRDWTLLNKGTNNRRLGFLDFKLLLSEPSNKRDRWSPPIYSDLFDRCLLAIKWLRVD